VREISLKHLIKFLDNYIGKQVELGTSPIWTVQTFKSFQFTDSENELKLYDGNFDSSRQEIVIEKDKIVNIFLLEGETIYDSVVSINLQNGKIDFTISSMPVRCFKCHKVIDVPFETKWAIQGIGGYGSHFDGCGKLDIPICDDCLYFNILGLKDGEFDE